MMRTALLVLSAVLIGSGIVILIATFVAGIQEWRQTGNKVVAIVAGILLLMAVSLVAGMLAVTLMADNVYVRNVYLHRLF